MGPELFDVCYGLIRKHRKIGTDDAIVFGELKHIVGKNNKTALNLCFQLDQVVFMENVSF